MVAKTHSSILHSERPLAVSDVINKMYDSNTEQCLVRWLHSTIKTSDGFKTAKNARHTYGSTHFHCVSASHAGRLESASQYENKPSLVPTDILTVVPLHLHANLQITLELTVPACPIPPTAIAARYWLECCHFATSWCNSTGAARLPNRRAVEATRFQVHRNITKYKFKAFELLININVHLCVHGSQLTTVSI
jgi:hypothetical protein